jgi:hypothetical protein
LREQRTRGGNTHRTASHAPAAASH